MLVKVWRMFHEGHPLDRASVRAGRPSSGELAVNRRLAGRDARADVYFAGLMNDDHSYVIPVLDAVRLVEVRGRWLRLSGVEVIPQGRSLKRLSAHRYPQEWWCRVETRVGGKWA